MVIEMLIDRLDESGTFVFLSYPLMQQNLAEVPLMYLKRHEMNYEVTRTSWGGYQLQIEETWRVGPDQRTGVPSKTTELAKNGAGTCGIQCWLLDHQYQHLAVLKTPQVSKGGMEEGREEVPDMSNSNSCSSKIEIKRFGMIS